MVVNGCRRHAAAVKWGRGQLACAVNDGVAAIRASLARAAYDENVERRDFDPIEAVLAAHGDYVPSAGAITARAMTESSGNPNAENKWDGNAAAGTPSIGLMQVIAPTFDAYALPGHTDIWNPVDNIIAAVRYANAAYGSFDAIAYGTSGY